MNQKSLLYNYQFVIFNKLISLFSVSSYIWIIAFELEQEVTLKEIIQKYVILRISPGNKVKASEVYMF